jgi:hypothetical protein
MTELSPETKALIAAAEMPPLSNDHRMRMKHAIAAEIVAGTATITTASAAAAKGSGLAAVATKALLVVSVVAMTTGAIVFATRDPAPPTVTVRASSTPSASAMAAATTSAPAQVDVAVPVESLAEAPRVTPAPAIPAVTATPKVAAPSTTTTTATTATTTKTIDERRPPASSLMVQEEARILRTAHEALEAGDSSRALVLLDEHAAKFPRGVLEPERSAERVVALCRAGRPAEARTAAERFLSVDRPPHLVAKVRGSCGGSEK